MLPAYPVRLLERPEVEKTEIKFLFSGFDFIETMGIELVAGRSLSQDFPSDDRNALVLNETAVYRLGWDASESAINQQIEIGEGERRTVVGVVKDFHMQSLHEKVEPTAILIRYSEE